FFSSRRRHTRSTRDWSSDVCSSDLLMTSFCAFCALTCAFCVPFPFRCAKPGGGEYPARTTLVAAEAALASKSADYLPPQPTSHQIGRASCRERVQLTALRQPTKRTT